MKKKSAFLFILLFVIWEMSPLLFAADEIVLKGDLTDYAIGRHMGVLKDAQKQWTIDDVRSKPLAAAFEKCESNVPGYGFTSSAYWFQFQIYHPESVTSRWYLEIAYPLLDRIDFYIPGKDGRFHVKTEGDLKPFHEREFNHHYFIFPFEGRQGRWVYYLRVETESALNLPITIRSEKNMQRTVAEENFFLGIYYGILVMLLIYNLLIFFSIKDINYLYFVLLIASFILLVSSINGIGFRYIWPNYPQLFKITPALIAIAIMMWVIYTRSYLEMKRYLPRADTAICVLLTCTLVFFPFLFLLPYRAGIYIAVFLAGMTSCIGLYSGIRSMMMKLPQSYYYSISLFGLLIFSLLIALKSVNLISSAYITIRGFEVGSAASFVLFSLGLAEKLKSMSMDQIKSAEKILEGQNRAQQAEAKYRLLVENALEGIYRSVPEGQFLMVNASLASMLGYKSPDDVIDNITDIGHQVYVNPMDRQVLLEMLACETDTVRFETQLYRRDKSKLWVLINARAEKDTTGAIDRIEGMIIDINERKLAETRLSMHKTDLEKLVGERTQALESANHRLSQEISERKKIEAALRESEERYRSVMTAAPDPIIVYDINGNVTFCNHAFTGVFGWGLDEIKGRRLDFVPEQSRDETMDAIARLLSGEKILSLETDRLTKDGKQLSIVASASLIRDRYGQPAGSVVILRDITEKKEIEMALKESEKRIRSFLEAAPDPIVVHDIDRRVIYLNPAFSRVFGWQLDEVKGRRIGFVPEANRKETRDVISRLLLEEKIQSLHTKRLKKDGQLLDVHMNAALLKGRDGRIDGMIITLRDVSEANRLQAALRESEVRFRSVMESVPHPIVVYDMQGRVKYLNKAFTRVFGWRLDDEKGRKLDHFVPKEHWDETRDLIDKVKNGQWLTGIETRRCTKAGAIIPVSLSGSVYYDKNGKPIGSVVTLQDITSRKTVEQELKNARDAAEKAARVKSEFLANMSHEIRTPMNAVIGMTHLALNTQPTPKQKDYLLKIQTAANALLGIINDILDFSKIEAGKLKIDTVQFHVEELFDSVSTVVSQKVEEKGLILSFNADKDVPSYLFGDPLRLSQILINLVNNAVKFTSRGKITVTINVLKKETHRVLLNFSVKDTGIGMSHEQTQALFQPFVQADGSTTRRQGGTGLGLSICKQLVELMDGKIRVESMLEEGSEFSFYLWLGIGLDSTEAPDEKEPAFPDLRVLVVDDSELAGKSLLRMLKQLKIPTTMVKSGTECLTELQTAAGNEPYQLVLMDWRMPGMDGIQTAGRIRSDAMLQDVKIVIVTAFGGEEIRRKADQVGVDGLLLKPVNRSMLFDCLLNLFDPAEETSFARKAGDDTDAVVDKSIDGSVILLVEDNEINRQVAVELLESAGARVFFAENGLKAVDMITNGKQTFDAVLMDLQMPVMDGYEATRQIRNHPRLRHLPIIGLTAHAMKEERQKCIDIGMDDHVAKPIEPEALFDTLRKWINKASAQEKTDVCPLIEKQQNQKTPQFANIDIDAGMARVMGNQKLYLALLKQFMVEYANHADLIQQHITENELHQAEQKVHSIKGVSGNLGAAKLYRLSIELEKKIKMRTVEDIAPVFSMFSQELNAVMNEIHTMLPDLTCRPEKPVNENVGQCEQLQPCFEKLYALLEDNDGDALDFFEENKATIAHHLQEGDLSGLEKSMERFEFDKSMEILKQLSSNYRIPMEVTSNDE